MANRFVLSGLQVLDNNANPLSGALLYSYQAGTSNPQNTYSDSDLTVANTNPVVADSAGRFGDIFMLAASYKFILKTSAGVTVEEWDDYEGATGASEATEAQTDARTASDVYVSPRRIAEGAEIQGQSIASAATLELPTVGTAFGITGTTGITAISERAEGREIEIEFSAALTLTHNATSLILPGGRDITTAAGDVARFRSKGSGNWRCVSYTKANGYAVVRSPYRGHLSGLNLSNNATDANNDIDITAGEASDSTNAVLMQLSSGITKRLDATWTVGTGNGGLDTGAKANSTTYHVWLIMRSDTGVVDALFSTSATSPTMPTNYDYKRRIGAIRTDGSGNIRAFIQRGDEFWYGTPVQDVNAANPGTSAVTRTLSTPSGVRCKAIMAVKFTLGANAASLYLSSPDTADTAPGDGAFTILGTTTANISYGKQAQVWTGTSSDIRSRVSIAEVGVNVLINTLGWVDNRGRFD